ncbi:hypothetical protein RCL1_000603 [Eukaryota sp. TZLM3-RCL]
MSSSHIETSSHHGGPSHSFKHTLFFKLQSAFQSKHNFWSCISTVWGLLQIISFSVQVALPPVFDLGPLFDFISFSALRNWDIKPLYAIHGTLVSVPIVGFILMMIFHSSQTHSKPSFLIKSFRAYLEVLSTVFFLPSLSFFATFLRCFGTPNDSSPSFSSRIAPYCGDAISEHPSRTIAVIFIILLVSIAIFNSLLFDDDPCSKRLFAKSNARFSVILVLTQVFFISLFHLFPSRIWLFRLIYFFSAVFCSYLLIKYPPFYKSKATLLYTTGLGLWVGSGIGLLLYFLLPEFSITEKDWLNGIIFYAPMGICCVILGLLFKFKMKKLREKMEILYESFVQSNLIDENNKLSGDFHYYDLDFSVANLSIPQSFLTYDVMTRVLFPKPTTSKFVPLIKALFAHGEVKYPESVLFLCFKLNFEINILKDPVASAITTQSIKSLDVDHLVDEELMFLKSIKSLENLRRTLSTGQSVDTSSFLLLQKQQKELTSLHHDCLEMLYTFWGALLNEHTDLSILPTILHKIQSTKNTLESLFQHLLFSNHGSPSQSLLQSYALFLREVECDEERALLIDEQANLMSSSERSGSHDGSSFSGSMSQTQRKNNKRRSKFSKFTLLSGTSETSKKSAIKTLKYSVIFALILMLVLSILSYLLVSNVLKTSQDQLNSIYELNHVDFLLQYLGKSANILHLFSQSPFLSHFITPVATTLIKECEHLSFHLRRLVVSTSKLTSAELCPRGGSRVLSTPDFELQSLLLEPRFSAKTLVDLIPYEERIDIMNFYQFGLRTALRSVNFANQMLSTSTIDRVDLASITFDLSFAPTMMSVVYDFITEKAFDYYRRSVLFQVILGIAILCIILIIGLGLFARSFAKIKTELDAIINLFHYIPKTEVSRILESSKFDPFRSKKKRSKLQSMEIDDDFSDVDSVRRPSAYSLPPDTSEEQNTFDLVLNFDPKNDGKNLGQSEENSEIKPLNIRIKLALITGILISLVLLLFLMFHSYETSSLLSSIHESVNLAIIGRSTAADITVLDRRISSNVQLYTGYGDAFFLQSYFDILDSGIRTNLLQELMSMRLSTDQLSLLGQSNSIINELRYLELIAITLASSVFPVHSDILPQNFTFEYDTRTETDFNRKFINTYSGPINYWYTNTIDDLALPPEDRITLARHTLASPRWTSLFTALMGAVESTARSVSAENVARVENQVADVRFDLIQNLIVSAILTLIFGLSVGLIVYFRNRLRFGKILVYFLISISTVIFFSSLYVSISLLSYSDELKNKTNTAVDIMNYVIDSEWFFLSIKRRAQIFAYEWEIAHFGPMLDHAAQSTSMLTKISSKSLCDGAKEMQHVCDKLSPLADTVLSLIHPFTNVASMSAKLKYSTLSSNVDTRLENIEWNISEITVAQRPMFDLPGGLSLTTTNHDMSLSLLERHELAMGLVSTRFFEQTSDTILARFGDMRNLVLDAFAVSFESFFDLISSYNSLVIYLVSAWLVVFSIVVVIVYVSGSPEKVEYSHIKQRIREASIEKYTRQYVVALSGLAIVLLFFVGFSIYAFSSFVSYPQVLTLAGKRAALASGIVSDVVQYSSRPEEAKLVVNRVSEGIEELLRTHNLLVLYQISANEEQESLLFSSNYNDESRSHLNVSAHFGLHSLLVQFVLRSRTFVADYRAGNENLYPIVEELVYLGISLEHLSLDSLDIFFKHFESTTQMFSRFAWIIFIIFVALLVISYLASFRVMLKKLEEEEHTTLQFLDMLSDSAAMSVDVIRDFMSSRM